MKQVKLEEQSKWTLPHRLKGVALEVMEGWSEEKTTQALHKEATTANEKPSTINWQSTATEKQMCQSKPSLQSSEKVQTARNHTQRFCHKRWKWRKKKVKQNSKMKPSNSEVQLIDPRNKLTRKNERQIEGESWKRVTTKLKKMLKKRTQEHT